MRFRSLLFVLWWILPCVVSGQTGSMIINVRAPATNAVVGDALFVRIGVTSTYEVTSVGAQIEDRAAELVFDGSFWTNTISLAGLARGEKTLAVTGRDVFGNTRTAQTTILLDRPPLLRVEEPALGTVGVSSIDVRAYAADDSPGDVVMYLYQEERATFRTLLMGTNSLTGRITNSPTFPALGLWFGAKDSLNQQGWIYRSVGFPILSNLQEVARYEGPILDVSANAVLFHTNADFIVAYPTPNFPPWISSTQGVAII